MNEILVILITGMAVLGAYYLADLIAWGVEKPKHSEAILLLPGPASAAQALEITLAVRRLLPRCQVIASAGEQLPDPPLPTAGLRGVRITKQDQLQRELLQELDLQSGKKVL